MFALIYQAEGGFERHVETWGHELGFSPTCREAFVGSRLAPLENIRFDDSHTQVPPGLELSASELAGIGSRLNTNNPVKRCSSLPQGRCGLVGATRS